MNGPRARGSLPLGLEVLDPEVAHLVAAEAARQERTIDMVASENFAPLAVLEAQGSVLQNKYAVGYPGNRHYDGCEFVDEVENLAIERAKALFGAEHANVQSYSGSNANAAVLHALCRPGDQVLGFDFRHGGHPTHYSGETFAGRFYKGACYGVAEADRLVHLDDVAALADKLRPKVIFAGWSCYPRGLDFAGFRAIADEVGAYLVCDMAHFSGLVAAGLYPDPVPFADVCTMTVHKTLGGARGGAILCRADLAERIDDGVFPGDQGAPLMAVIAGKAVTFLLARTEEFRDRMARTLAGARTVAGAIGAAASETGVSVVTGGTDVHLLICDTSASGTPAEKMLERLHGVSVNANALRIAYDPAPEGTSSGLRLGTASLATRGFDGAAFEELGDILASVLGPDGDRRHDELARRTAALASAFPVYGAP